jgi:hypothetical protein
MAAVCSISVVASLTGLGQNLDFAEKFNTTTPVLATYLYDSVAITTEAALDLGGITTVEYVVIKNMDATNYIEIDPSYTAATFRAGITLAAGKVAVFKPAGSVYVLADTAAVNVEYLILGTA